MTNLITKFILGSLLLIISFNSYSQGCPGGNMVGNLNPVAGNTYQYSFQCPGCTNQSGCIFTYGIGPGEHIRINGIDFNGTNASLFPCVTGASWSTFTIEFVTNVTGLQLGWETDGNINSPCPAGAVVLGPVFSTTPCSNPFPPSSLAASPQSGCPPYNTLLTGNCATGVIRWYDNSAGTGVGIGNNHTIISDSTFFAKCYDASQPAGCQYSNSRNITVIATNNVYDTLIDTICDGETISFGGNNYSTSGFYNDTLLSSGGCDSIVTLNLLVAPIYRDTLNENICAGDIFNFNGQNISVSGIYNDTLISLYHCDSIITLNLTINPIYRDTFYQVICNGQSYSFGGNNYNIAGTYYDSLASVYGCDSIEVLYLTITPIIRDTIFASICNNQSYSFGGNNYNTTGNYSDTLVTASGCDSISTLSLVVNNHSYDTIRISICDGDSYLFRGTIFTTSGSFNDTIPNSSGCDSISTLILTVNPTYSTTIYDTICEGDNYNFLGKNINLAGTYFDTLDTRFGCDSAFTLFLHVISIKRDTIVASICEGDSYLFDGIPRTLDGIYTQTTILANGCDSITTLILSISPNPIVSIVGDSILCNNTLDTLSSNNTFNQYNWNTGENTHSISFYNAGKYVLTVTNQYNCSSSDSLTIEVINCEDTCQIYVPNSFTPDNDGFNDLFFVKVNDECIFSEYRFLIFNRWGQLLFESNNTNETWDGSYKGLKSQIDTYIWLLEYKKQGDVVATKKIGHVNILR